ncbi:MAG: trypsin-like serine protease [Myxococcota bacterium]
MKKLSRVVVVVSAVLTAACGNPSTRVAAGTPGTHQQAIINGEPCGRDDFPSAVALLTDATVDLGGFGTQRIKTVMCTGTLIAPDVVLTAAHCLDASLLTLGFGTVQEQKMYVSAEPDLTALAQQSTEEFPDDAVEAHSWAHHPEFDPDAFNSVNGPGNFHDVGLLFLSRPFPRTPAYVITATESAELAEGKDLDIVGWGQQTVTNGPLDPPPPGTVGRKVCAQSFLNELGTHEMQVGGDNTTQRKCHGDSGGPSYLRVTADGDNLRLVGITSHAYDQEDCNKGGVDTRADVWRDWIEQEMMGRCGAADGGRVWCDVTGIPEPGYVFPVYDGGYGPDEEDAGTTPENDAGTSPGADAGSTGEVDAGTTAPPGNNDDTGSAGDSAQPFAMQCAHHGPSGGGPGVAGALALLAWVARLRRRK